MRFFCSEAKNTSGLLEEMAVFFRARAFLSRVSPGLENELFRAESQGRRGRREMMNFFCQKNSASLLLCARLMMGEFASDFYLPQHY